MPKVLVLAASWFQIPVIRCAKDRGHHVITCDNRPENPGHALADESWCISTTDFEAVARAAERAGVDAVICYATDVAAPTAAYVAERLALPGHPLEAVRILTDKDRFREFQQRHDYPHPAFWSGCDPDGLEAAIGELGLPVMVKPVDSSGSRGVSRVDRPEQLAPAFEAARRHSRRGAVIVEEFLERDGYQLTGDGFVLDGKLVFDAFANQHFAPEGRPHFPVGESLPAAFEERILDRARVQIDRLVGQLGLRTGALNFDLFVDGEGEVHMIEIGPRAGGNSIPVLIREATGADLVGAVLDAALGERVEIAGNGSVYPTATYNLVDLLEGLELRDRDDSEVALRADETLRRALVQQRMCLDDGTDLLLGAEPTPWFGPDRLAVGWTLLRFEDAPTMLEVMDHMDRHLEVAVRRRS